jgi:hypothetical protein
MGLELCHNLIIFFEFKFVVKVNHFMNVLAVVLDPRLGTFFVFMVLWVLLFKVLVFLPN